VPATSRPADRLSGQVVRVPGYRSRCPGFHFRSYQIFWGVVGVERSPFSLVSTNEELLERKSSGSGLENREYGRRDPPRWLRDTFLSRKVGTNFSDDGSRFDGIVYSPTKVTELVKWVCEDDSGLDVHQDSRSSLRQCSFLRIVSQLVKRFLALYEILSLLLSIAP
jgi:hypothetical protein